MQIGRSVRRSLLSRFLVGALATGVLVTTACGDSDASSDVSSGSSSASGTVAASTLKAVSAVARYSSIATSTVNGQTTKIRGLQIFISDKPNTCSGMNLSSATVLDVAVRGDTVKAGTYKVIDGMQKTPEDGEAVADFNSVSDACKDVVAQASTGGTVTITKVDTRVTGTLDITFEGGKVSGAFEAELCPDDQVETSCAP